MRDQAPLEDERARRWWQHRRSIGSLRRAAAFVDDVGFALLFPKPGMALPSLWEAVSDRPAPSADHDWGPDSQRVWAWKDELPRRGLAWYGRFVRGRPSLLAPSLLADLYPRTGEPEDFTDGSISLEARRIAEMILVNGPSSTAMLREAVGVEGNRGQARFSRSLNELGRALVVTHYGTEEQGSGWPSAVLELTARAFPIPRGKDPVASRRRAALRFLDTVIEVRAADLGNAFGWRADPARAVLEGLVASSHAERRGSVYRPGRPPTLPTRSAPVE